MSRTRKPSTVQITILTLDDFNELDSLVAFAILNRVRKPGWRVSIASPGPRVRSMNGLVIEAQSCLSLVHESDAVLIGSGRRTRELVADPELMSQLVLDPGRQLVGAQCSGTLVLAKLGLLEGVPACTDLATKPWVQEAGVEILNQPFIAAGNVATAGGCLASQYLAAWTIARLAGVHEASSAIEYVAPVGEKDEYVSRMLSHIAPYLHDAAPA